MGDWFEDYPDLEVDYSKFPNDFLEQIQEIIQKPSRVPISSEEREAFKLAIDDHTKITAEKNAAHIQRPRGSQER